MAENVFTAPLIQLYGRSELCAEGVMTLLEYSTERVTLLCKDLTLSIKGSELQVALLSQNKAVISGRIKSFEFL